MIAITSNSLSGQKYFLLAVTWKKSMAELAHSHEGRVAISQLLIPVPKNPLCCSRTSS